MYDWTLTLLGSPTGTPESFGRNPRSHDHPLSANGVDGFWTASGVLWTAGEGAHGEVGAELVMASDIGDTTETGAGLCFA